MSDPDLVTLFQALADRTRLRLLHLLSAGEICVCYFVAILAESQPKISRHLSYLRKAGLVSARRDGKWIHYSLVRPADERQAAVLDATLAALEGDRDAKRDRLALERACCAARLPETLQNAPKPELGRTSTG
jgi:ArsR family transcriptional regulator, arsenate/arsenite/antimonite-responsive transcriptional repressor